MSSPPNVPSRSASRSARAPTPTSSTCTWPWPRPSEATLSLPLMTPTSPGSTPDWSSSTSDLAQSWRRAPTPDNLRPSYRPENADTPLGFEVLRTGWSSRPRCTCDRARRNPRTALQVEASVYLAAVAHGRDGDHAGAVVNAIDHPVVTRPYAQIGPVAGRGCDTSRARIGGESIDDLGDRLTDRRVELPQRAAGTRPDINGVGGHAGSPAYRSSSALTCSQGVGSPGSSMAASASAASSASSAARRASMNDSGTMAATRSP